MKTTNFEVPFWGAVIMSMLSKMDGSMGFAWFWAILALCYLLGMLVIKN